ncbi:LITAF-like zinc ribbon domain-containing protein [Entophlyctis helioformis]|nr:LITAF-like zinc ribbon domain-containing protein [Entophlyctis helioformis]
MTEAAPAQQQDQQPAAQVPAASGAATTGQPQAQMPMQSAAQPQMAYTVQPPMVFTKPAVGGTSGVVVVCPNCHNTVSTTVDISPSLLTYIVAGVTFVVCCPLSWVPFFIDDLKDATHSCPVCRITLGSS